MHMEQAQGRLWVLLVYKVPREPTSSRAYVWRKLKKLGALLLHDAVWVLPATAWTRVQLQWLAVEITELEGEALLWETRMTLRAQDYFQSPLGTLVRTRLLIARGGYNA